MWPASVVVAVTIVTILTIFPVVRVPSRNSAGRWPTGGKDEQPQPATWTTIDGTYAVFRFRNGRELRVSQGVGRRRTRTALRVKVLSIVHDLVRADRTDDSDVDF